jgi:hypothetical protein
VGDEWRLLASTHETPHTFSPDAMTRTSLRIEGGMQRLGRLGRLGQLRSRVRHPLASSQLPGWYLQAINLLVAPLVGLT